jgi:hypothetical protein
MEVAQWQLGVSDLPAGPGIRIFSTAPTHFL